MEKFALFNDARTGVNPFTVAVYAPPFVDWLMGAVLFLVRLPFVLVLTAMLVVSDAASTRLPTASLRNLVKASFQRPLCKLLLIVIGVWKVDETHVNRQTVRIRCVPNCMG